MENLYYHHSSSSCLSQSISRFIKSIEMMDYLFNEFYHLFIQHVFHNSSYYFGITALVSTKPIDFDNSLANQELYFSSLKYLIQSTKNILFNPMSFFNTDLLNSQYPPQSFIKFLIWLCDPLYNSLFAYLTPFKLVQYFVTTEKDHDQLFEDVTYVEIIEDFNEIVRYSIIRGDLQTICKVLDILLATLYSFVPLNSDPGYHNEIERIKTFILIKILQVAVLEEQVSILEYLFLNYLFLFKKVIIPSKTKSMNVISKREIKETNNDLNDEFGENAIFTNEELLVLLVSSLNQFNIKITEFFLSVCYITNSKFNEFACTKSYIILEIDLLSN